MAQDLGLGELRASWGQPRDVTPPDAAAEWDATKFGRSTGVSGREVLVPSVEDFRAAEEEIVALRERMAQVPYEDHEQWRRVASFVSGVFGAWSSAVEDTPGPLAHVADELARSAQVRPELRRSTGDHGPMGLHTATLLAFAAQRPGAAGQLAVLAHMTRLLRDIRDYQNAQEDVVRERGILRLVATDLKEVRKGLREAEELWAGADVTARGVELREPRPAMGGVRETTVYDRTRSRAQEHEELGR